MIPRNVNCYDVFDTIYPKRELAAFYRRDYSFITSAEQRTFSDSMLSPRDAKVVAELIKKIK